MIDFKALSEPFAPDDVEWRIQSSGTKNGKPWALCLAYITNRGIMNRLDEVCGPENWQNEFRPGPLGGVICGISIRVDRGTQGLDWITKWDGSDETDIEKIKGGLSGAMKRAGSQFGIGRYLYNLDATWAVIGDKGQFSAKTKDGTWFKWSPPALPSWALPAGTKSTGGRAADFTPEPEETPPPKTEPPKTEAPEPSPESNPSKPTARGIIQDIKVATGESNGKPWKRYGVKIGDTWYGTFSESIGRIAEDNHFAEAVVSYTTDAENRHTIVELVPVATKPE